MQEEGQGIKEKIQKDVASDRGRVTGSGGQGREEGITGRGVQG
jgi:hypothetical protein